MAVSGGNWSNEDGAETSSVWITRTYIHNRLYIYAYI